MESGELILFPFLVSFDIKNNFQKQQVDYMHIEILTKFVLCV